MRQRSCLDSRSGHFSVEPVGLFSGILSFHYFGELTTPSVFDLAARWMVFGEEYRAGLRLQPPWGFPSLSETTSRSRARTDPFSLCEDLLSPHEERSHQSHEGDNGIEGPDLLETARYR